MQHALHALTEELRRLKTAGVKAIAVSDESVLALRRAIAGRVADRTSPPPLAAAPAVAAASAPRSQLSSPLVAPKPRVAVATLTVARVPATSLPPAPIVNLPDGDKASRWAALLALVTGDPICRANVRPGKKVVLGVGSLEARIMFVGEAPGAEEEIQGEPFVGPAGQLLTKMIQAMGMKRSEVYIGNIMNWRPQMATVAGQEQIGNRPPTEDEMRYCLPYLRAQIEVVNSEVIVALGKTAVEGLLGFGKFKTLGEARGRWHEFAGKPLMVTYHPSYILREPTNRKKRLIWEDLLKVMERVALPISEKQRGYFLDK